MQGPSLNPSEPRALPEGKLLPEHLKVTLEYVHHLSLFTTRKLVYFNIDFTGVYPRMTNFNIEILTMSQWGCATWLIQFFQLSGCTCLKIRSRHFATRQYESVFQKYPHIRDLLRPILTRPYILLRKTI